MTEAPGPVAITRSNDYRGSSSRRVVLSTNGSKPLLFHQCETEPPSSYQKLLIEDFVVRSDHYEAASTVLQRLYADGRDTTPLPPPIVQIRQTLSWSIDLDWQIPFSAVYEGGIPPAWPVDDRVLTLVWNGPHAVQRYRRTIPASSRNLYDELVARGHNGSLPQGFSWWSCRRHLDLSEAELGSAPSLAIAAYLSLRQEPVLGP